MQYGIRKWNWEKDATEKYTEQRVSQKFFEDVQTCMRAIGVKVNVEFDNDTNTLWLTF